MIKRPSPAPRLAVRANSPTYAPWIIGSIVVAMLVSVGIATFGKRQIPDQPRPTKRSLRHSRDAEGKEKEVLMWKETIEPRDVEATPAKEPSLAAKEYRSRLNLSIWKINLSGLAAFYCDAAGKRQEAFELRSHMGRLYEEMQGFLEELRGRGENPFVDDVLYPSDELVYFNSVKLSDRSMDERERLLSSFVAGVHAGSRARVVVKRGSEFLEWIVFFDQRPKDLLVIVQMAGLIPTGKKSEEYPAESPAFSASVPTQLAFVEAVQKPELRGALIEQWRGIARQEERGSGYAAAIVSLIEQGESPIDSFLQGLDPDASLFYSASQHAQAAKALAKKDRSWVVETVAAGHLSEALRVYPLSADAVATAALLGYSQTKDQKAWGSPGDVPFYDRMTAWRSGSIPTEPRTPSDLRIRYVDAVFMLKEAFASNEGYRNVHATLEKMAAEATGARVAHLKALAKGLKQTAGCAACKGGRIACPRCAGTGLATLLPCSKCRGSGRVSFDIGDGTSGTKTCPSCQNKKGITQFGGKARCPDCHLNDHRVTCPTCEGTLFIKQLQVPSLKQVLREERCTACEGTGSLIPRVIVSCGRCLGLGVRLIPTADPSALMK